MSSRERVAQAVRGERPAQIPASFWGHNYATEQTMDGLVQQTIEFQRLYGWDFIKINPRAQYHVEDWGVRYDYPAPPGTKCVRADYPIHGPADYARIRRLDPEQAPVLAGHLDAVERIAREFPEVPVIMTVFNPLSVLKYSAESEQAVVGHLRSNPAEVRAALGEIRQTFQAFSAAAIRRGASGIYLATTAFASHDLWTPEEYRAWSRSDDLALLESAAAGSFNVLHVCRARNFLREFADYPVHAWSWATTEPGNPRLGQTPWMRGAAAGGIGQETTLQEGNPAGVTEEFQRAMTSTGGRGFLLAPGCSIPPGTPTANLMRLRELSLAGR